MFMELSKENKPRWYFYLVWVAAHFIAFIIAGFLAIGITLLMVTLVGDMIQVGGREHITEDYLGTYILLPVIGLVMGVMQYFLLRRYLPQMGWWIAATVAGWLLLFVLVPLLIALLRGDNSVGSLMLGLLLIGVTIALPQWWMLRQRVVHAFWWIILIAVSLAAGGLLRFVTSDPGTVVGFAVLYPLATAVACWLMLRTPVITGESTPLALD
jgi:hypothetical protein